MMPQLITCLNEAGLYGWEISQTITRGWEFYFIGHRLDQHRAKEVNVTTVRVYVLSEDGENLGTASADLPSDLWRIEDIRAFVGDLAYRASLVRNRPYRLQPRTADHPEHSNEGKWADTRTVAADHITAVRSLPETPETDVNSYEIFAEAKYRWFRNSEGIDVEEFFPHSFAEVVINARLDGHEVELYRSYNSGTCDAAAVQADLARTMQFGMDRLQAVPTPALGSIDVLFSTRDAVSIYEFFTERLQAGMIYRKYSDWSVGTDVAPGATGDRLTVTAVRELPNSSRNTVFDAEGAPITDTVLMKDNVPQAVLGSRMYSEYLGLTGSFIPSNYRICGGTGDEASLRDGRYLEAVEFSDFQGDEVTGDIFGEIRLGYLHDGDDVRIVTGGSVSGSMFDFIRDLHASAQTCQYDNMEIPALTRLCGVTVTGAE